MARACVLLVLLCWVGPSPGQDVRVLTSPEHSAESIGRDRLRLMFTMRTRQWPEGQPVRLFVLPDSDPVHERFVRDVLGTFPYVLRTTWDRAVYTGTGLAPTIVRDEAEMLKRVHETPGAIGYITRTAPSKEKTP